MTKNGFDIDLLEEVPCISWRIHEDSDMSFFKESIHDAAGLFCTFKEQHNNLKIIVDLTNVFRSSAIDVEWVNREIMTELNLRFGVCNLAVIKSKNSVAHELFKEFFEKNEQIHNVEAFETRDEAIAWLKRLENAPYKGSIDVYWNI